MDKHESKMLNGQLAINNKTLHIMRHIPVIRFFICHCYSEPLTKVVIARTPHLMRGTWQSLEIASLRPVHHAVQGFVHNDHLKYVNKFKSFTIIGK